jgi:hypothetical protein
MGSTRSGRGGGSQKSTPAGNRGGNRKGPSSENDPTRQAKAGAKGKAPVRREGGGRPKLTGSSAGRGPQPAPRS